MSATKKVTIPIKDLPAVTENNKYLVRYRVVSEDRNRVSQWSPIYTVSGLAVVAAASGSYDVIQSGNIINVVWTDTNDRNSYDIFVKYGSGNYVYHGTSTSKAYTFIKNGTVSLTVLVQVSNQKHSVPAGLTNPLKVFEKTITLV